MLTYEEAGQLLGVTRQRAEQLCKIGMPRGSAEEVLQWRKDNPRRRRGKNIPPEPPKGALFGMKGFKYEPEVCETPREVKLPKTTGDPLYDSLQNSITVADEAYKMVMESMSGVNPGALGIRLTTHTKALEARFKAEALYREELVNRGVLVPINDAIQLYRPKLEMIVKRIHDFPAKRAPHAANQSVHTVLKILQEEADSIIREAERTYA